MTDEGLARIVAAHEWYHTIELPGGVVTPGFFDHRPLLKRYGFPREISGRALDVGTFDGFFAFHMERLGAEEVVATDVPDVDTLDWPAPMRKVGKTRFQPKHENFEIARRALNSRVKREFVGVYDISPQKMGMFDHVFVGSLLIHLRDPVRALGGLRSVCAGRIHLCEETHRGLDLVWRKPAAKFAATSWDMTWWIPNRRCLVDWLTAAGFERIEQGATFVLPYSQHTGLRGGVRHSVVQAIPG